MSEKVYNEDRRNLLKLAAAGVVAVPLTHIGLARAGHHAMGGNKTGLPPVDMNSTAAQALKYVHDANNADASMRKSGAICANCNLVRGESGEWRGCVIFPRNSVNENGWCTGWVLKS